MKEIVIISYKNNIIDKKTTYYEDTEILNNLEQDFDYCTKCEILIINKYINKHCHLCNKCHYKYNQYCNFCKGCYDNRTNDDKSIILHKKKCDKFNKFISNK